LRQRLGCDAIPVLFDEAEGEDQRAHSRLQRILELVRQSSSETGARLIKGTATGNATSYQIRSCFAFSSINASLVQQSDRSRVTVVELTRDNMNIPFDEILAETELFRRALFSASTPRLVRPRSSARTP
jgi:putative DNA primase/helicase